MLASEKWKFDAPFITHFYSRRHIDIFEASSSCVIVGNLLSMRMNERGKETKKNEQASYNERETWRKNGVLQLAKRVWNEVAKCSMQLNKCPLIISEIPSCIRTINYSHLTLCNFISFSQLIMYDVM